MLIRSLHTEFCQYQITFRNNTQRTILWFKQTIGYFLKQTGVKTIDEITLKVVSEYFTQGKIQKQWSAKSIRTRMSSLGLFFRWCVQMGHLDENPIEKLPRPKLEKRIPDHLSVTEVTYLLEFLKSHPFRYTYERSRALAVVAVFIYTGIRLSELLNLKFSEVNFSEKIIFIRSGKGQKDRTVPIIGRLEKYLRQYLVDRQRLNSSCPFFFVSVKKDNEMNYQVVKRLFVLLTKQLKRRVYPHLMRHSFAVQMLEGGCDVFTLSKLLGHSDIKTTTIYLTATDAQKHRMAEKHPLY